jgi:thioredoxin-dependent peroxiredoxin
MRARRSWNRRGYLTTGARVAGKSGSTSVELDKKIPVFSRPSTTGTTWKSSDAAGKKLVLYFYPKDNTTGCTLEGQAFGELSAQFKKANTIIIGVSPDTPASHTKFKDKMAFPFELLADEDKSLCEQFGVWKEKSMYGRKFMGVERSTFLIDETGVLRREWRKVRVPGHAAAVLEAAKTL